MSYGEVPEIDVIVITFISDKDYNLVSLLVYSLVCLLVLRMVVQDKTHKGCMMVSGLVLYLLSGLV